MGEKAKVKETVQLYSKVWQLSSFRRIILNLIVSTLAISLILAFLRTSHTSFAFIQYSFMLYLSIYATSMLLGTLLMFAIVRKKDSPLDARRTAGSAQFGVIFWVIMGVTGGILDWVFVSDYFEIRFLLIPGTIIAGMVSRSFYPWKTVSLEMSVQDNYEYST